MLYLYVITGSFIEEMMKVANGSDVTVVKMEFQLDKSVEAGLYEYITESIWVPALIARLRFYSLFWFTSEPDVLLE